MADGVTPYPAWDGTLSNKSRLGVITANEVRLAFRNTWSMIAIGLGLAWGFASIIEFYQIRQGGAAIHGWDGFTSMLDQLLWFALFVAATVGGPTLLEDARGGALELYLSRSVNRFEYLGGKVLAVLLLTTLIVALPAVVYWGASYVFYEEHPENWAMAPLGAFGYALMWGLMASGLALGLSSVGRSASGAALGLLGGFAALAFIVDPPGIFAGMAPLPELTADLRYTVLSPFAAFEQQKEWLFDLAAPHAFPYWWGLVYWAALTVLGWLLVAFRHPRARGEEHGRL
ncbi:MAG: ABC transporter permease [Euryarchaeota archaeon]|nr:ABC transporter permease [Euryarchaeota archaeon]